MDVRMPDGTVISNIPEGTTQKQLLDKLSQNGYDVSEIQRRITNQKPFLGPEGFAQSAKEEAATRSAPARFFQGVGETFDRYALGAKGLFTDLSPQERAQLEQNKALAQAGGTAATAGQIAGDVALTAPVFAAGGAVAAPVVRAATTRALPQTMAALTGASGGGAAAGALSSPDDRAGGAVAGGIGGAAGYGAGRVLTRTLGGVVTPTKEARELIDQGINVPIWQASDSYLRRLGELAKRLPVAGTALRSMEAGAMRDFNRNLVRDATPPRPILDEGGNILRWERQPITEVSDDTVNLLKRRFNEAYDAVYKNRRVPLDQTYAEETAGLIGATERYAPHLANEVQGTVNKIADTLARGTEASTTRSALVDAAGRPITQTTPGHAAVSAEAIKQAIAATDDAIGNAYRAGRGDLAEILKGFRDSLHELRTRALPPEVARSLADVNTAYTRFLPLQDAHGMLGAQMAGMVTPRQVLSAMKAGDRSAGKAAFEAGNIPGQRQVRAAARVLGNQLPDVGPGTADALSPLVMMAAPWTAAYDLGATALLGTKTGQRFLTGGLPGQAAARSVAGRQAVTAAAQAAGMGVERQREEQLRRALMGAAR